MSSTSSTSYTTPPYTTSPLLVTNRGRVSHETEALFRTSPWLFDAYQSALTATQDYSTSTTMNHSDDLLHAQDGDIAAGQLSIADARTRAYSAWSRAYRENDRGSRYNRPNISRALSTPPMPHIITEYTTSLLPHDYYVFLARCWTYWGNHGRATDPPAAVAGTVLPTITAHSFDLLDIDFSALQVVVPPLNENATPSEAAATDEIPVDQSTLDEIIGLIDELLEENVNFTETRAPEEDYTSELEDSDQDESVLGDSDKENSAPALFIPGNQHGPRYDERESSSEWEDSDKENVGVPSTLPSASRIYSPGDDAVSPSRDIEHDTPTNRFDSGRERRQPVGYGVLSTLYYNPVAEFAHAREYSPSFDALEESGSELEDSDKENIPGLVSLSTLEDAEAGYRGPLNNALMLTLDDDDSDSAASNFEDTTRGRDGRAPLVTTPGNDTDYDSDISSFSDNDSDDEYSASWNHSNSGNDYDHRQTENSATESNTTAGRPIFVAGQDHFTNNAMRRQAMLQRPIVPLPRRVTINHSKHQLEHPVEGEGSELASSDGAASELYQDKYTSPSTDSEAEVLEQQPLLNRVQLSNPCQTTATEYESSTDEYWLRGRRIVFPTSYERTRMHD